MKIGIINSGGDCAGINTVIATVVKRGTQDDASFVGFIKGWEGLLDLNYIDLDLNAVRGISHLGGTILGTTNKGRFAGKAGSKGEQNAIPAEILKLASDNCKQLNVDGLIVIGGDGTLSASLQLSDYGVPIVGVPKTMDNDLSATDQTFGFSTAVDVVADAIDKIHTTATSHDRVFLVECMGRHAGWVALHAGLAANANAILIPEHPVSIENLHAFIESRMSDRGSSIIIVAEGIDIGQNSSQMAGSEQQLAGVSEILMAKLASMESKQELELRHVVLGHTQRGGNPNVEDRILAKRYGVAAYEAFKDGKHGHMVMIKNNVIGTADIVSATGALKLVTKDDPIYQLCSGLGVFIN